VIKGTIESSINDNKMKEGSKDTHHLGVLAIVAPSMSMTCTGHFLGM
jgi:hypothetical protein